VAAIVVRMNEVCVQPSAKVTADSNTRKAIRVLHVDDEPSFLKTSKRCLEMEGPFQVTTASSAEEAMERIGKETFDIIVSDYDMPDKDGLEFLRVQAGRTRYSICHFHGKR
jgi:CheY-like chemotaxis protein